MDSYNCLDLFSGCGGFSKGITESGINVKVSNDIWEVAHNTNKLNLPNTTHILGDITQPIIKQKIIKECIKNKVNIIIGSPPCQSFSTAGVRKKNDKRSILYKDYIYIVEKIKPEICIMENVKGLLSVKIDNKFVIDDIINSFKNIGYKVQYKILNSAYYGVPQLRERVILIAVKQKYNIIFPIKTHNENNWITSKMAIDDLKNMNENKKFGQIYTKHGEQMINKIKKLKFGEHLYPKYHTSSYKLYPNKPSLTILCAHGSNIIHYEKLRFSTPREMARLQSFKDDFIFTGSASDMRTQIGNAVPCLLAKCIGENIINILKNKNKLI